MDGETRTATMAGTQGICGQVEGSIDMECRGIVFEGERPEFPSDAPDEIKAPHLVSQ